MPVATKCVSDTVELGHEFFFNVLLCFAHKPLISTLSFFTCFDKQGQGKPLATFGSLAQEVLFFLALREHLAKICGTWNLNTNLQVLWFRFHRPVLLPKYVFPASPADRLEGSYCISAGITSTDHWSLLCYCCKQTILFSNLNFVNSVYRNKLQKCPVFSCLGNGFPLPLC